MKNKFTSHLTQILFILYDFFSVILSTVVALALIYNLFGLQRKMETEMFRIVSTILILYFSLLCLFLIGGIYKRYWRTAGFADFARLFFSSLFVLFPAIPISMIPGAPFYPPSHIIFITLLFTTAVCAGRLLLHLYHSRITRAITSGAIQQSGRRLLIVGAGSAGSMFVRDSYINEKLPYKIIGFADDNPSKQGRIIEEVPVLGKIKDVPKICHDKNITDILFAIPSSNEETAREILNICSKTDCKIKTMPRIDEMLNSGDNVSKKIRNIEIEDLLPRTPIVLDNHALFDELGDKVVMVTGGGGSIGSELCKQIAVFSPKLLVIVDIYENNAYDLTNELHYLYPELQIKTLIASVRDKDRMNEICKTYKPHVIFHAAAHKHVPLMEDSPCEAIKNNVFGTKNMVECASENHIPKFVMISTDKAVNPTNVMGATKRLCEIIVQTMQKKSDTKFVAVRFGNVLGSNGSVIPLFKRQIERGGPVTLTHKEITRFFMTIPEAAQLVLQASLYANGGEIFVLDMGQPVKIYDLAVNLIRLSGYVPNEDIKIHITGLRPGEKLYEELLMAEENLDSTSHKKIFVGHPAIPNEEQIDPLLKALYNAAHNQDEPKTRELLMELVPTFHPAQN